MFTGIVETTGKVRILQRSSTGMRVRIIPEGTFPSLQVGDSVSVDGVCLTVERTTSQGFETFLSQETLQKTKFGRGLKEGYRANLEAPLTLQKWVGGHLVTGHVDTVAKIQRIQRLPEGQRWELTLLDPQGSPYLVPKGSIALDGVSLTLNRVGPKGFEVFLIPHTLEVTNFSDRKVGDLLNVEFDLIVKTVDTLLRSYGIVPKEVL